MSILHKRQDYLRGSLLESEVPEEPYGLFEQWLRDAGEAAVEEPNAMTLSTVGPDGRPSARIVLLRGFDANGFVFYTNYRSRKGAELEQNPRVALVFFWQPLERQVRVEGIAKKVSAAESDAYFFSRPAESRRGAHASDQSSVIAGRAELERRVADLEQRWTDGNVPRPENWGGYRVTPTRVEFWQGRASRLHDRLVYAHTDDLWSLSRLSP